MQKIHAEFPSLDFETIRSEAREVLLGFGGAHRIQDAYRRWLNMRSVAQRTVKARSSLAERGTRPTKALETAPAKSLFGEVWS